MTIDINIKIEHWRKKADLFYENSIRCFIKTVEGGFYSGEILLNGDKTIEIYDFIKRKNFRIYWLDIVLFDEYKEDVK